MKLSGYILVKNNERSIRYAIESIHPYLDELVIVDSGSTDSTLDIAREYTDRIYFNELDDFAKQRNFAIHKCRGEWIFFLDADEVVGENFPQAVKYLNKKYRSIIVPRYNIASIDPLLYVYDTPHHHYHDWQTRFFRNDGKSEFYNPVHHQLSNCKPRLKLSFIHVYHFHWALHGHAAREERMNYYESIKKGSGIPMYYLFEDFPYHTTEVIEQPEERIMQMLRADQSLLSYPPHPVPGGQLREKIRYAGYQCLTKAKYMLGL